MAKLPEELMSIRGMSDLLPPESSHWQSMEEMLTNTAEQYGFSLVRTPMVEPTGLFVRGIGEVTDIVEKEMYRWQDSLNGQDLALRPENTASCVRAYFEHGLQRSGVQRWFYCGPMFRHERPQKGRYRQFHQFGLEIMGTHSPLADVELIAFTHQLWQELGIPYPRLEINTLGNSDERVAHRARLMEYWQTHEQQLDEEAKARYRKNPLRLLDSKNPDLQSLIHNAPKLMDGLGEDSRALFDRVQELLQRLNIECIINPRLVRGLDYYNHTVFEWTTDQLGAQSTICGGGRYDGLAPLIANEPLGACGLAIGLERLFMLLPKQEENFDEDRNIYVAHEGDQCADYALKVAQTIRDQIFWQVHLNYDGGKFGPQIKKALEVPCRYIVLLGERERTDNQVTLKDLHENEQQTLSLADFVAWLDDLSLFDEEEE